MNLREAARTGLREIWTNKFRSVLSFSAISVGVASLLFTLAQTRGMQKSIEDAVGLMGPGRLDVKAKDNYVSRGLSKGLTSEDAAAIRDELPGLFMVYPKARSWGLPLRYGREHLDAEVEGITPEWRKRDWVYTLRGRFLNDWDVANAARVCVVIEPGGWIKKPFWASFWIEESPWETFITRRDILGQKIILNQRVFTVVGALREPPRDKDPRWYNWQRTAVLTPVSTYQRVLASRQGQNAAPTAVETVVIDTGDEKNLGASKRRIEDILKRRHRGEVDFEITDMREEIEGEMGEFKKILVAAITLGAVALLAGGIGIMNVTLATIFARIKEIGIRRALGAGRADIMAQFIIEALLLGLAGGVAGLGLGVAAVDYLSKHSDRDIAKMAWYHGLAAMAAASAVSVGFAAYPAYQASCLDPVEALREEA